MKTKKQDEYNFNIELDDSYHEIFETKDKIIFFNRQKQPALLAMIFNTKLSKSISNTDALQN